MPYQSPPSPASNEFDTLISRRRLLRCALGLGGIAFASALASQLNITPAEAAVDITIDDGVSMYAGGVVNLYALSESEGVFVAAGNVNDGVGGVHSVAGHVIWGLGTPPAPEVTTLVVGGNYTLTKFHSAFSGGNARIGGTVNGSTTSQRGGTMVGPDDWNGVSAPIARSPEEQWEFDPRWGYPGAENTRVVAGLGRETALRAATTGGKAIDYNGYWTGIVAPLISNLRKKNATGKVTFAAEPSFSGHKVTEPEVAGNPSIIASDFDGRMTFRGDGTSPMQVFDLDWAESERQLAMLGRKQWSVAFEGIPEDARIVVRVHGSNITMRYGWRCYLNGQLCSTHVNAPYTDPTFLAYRDLASRVLWLFDDACDTITVDAAHAWFDGTGGRVDIYTGWGVFNGDIDDRRCPGQLSQGNLMPGSLFIPGNARIHGSTNGKVLVRNNLDIDTWEHHNVIWRGMLSAVTGHKRATHSAWL